MGSQNKKVQTFLSQKIANSISKQLNAKITVGGVDIAFFNKIILENLLIEGQNNDTLLFSPSIVANIDSFSYKKQYIALSKLTFKNTLIYATTDSSGEYNYQFILNSAQNNKPAKYSWRTSCENFDFKNARILYEFRDKKPAQNIVVDNINLGIQKFKLFPDSLFFNISHLELNSNNRFQLNTFTAKISSSKKRFSITNINAKTPNSFISNSEFEYLPPTDSLETEGKLDFNIDNSELSFNDLALFFPQLLGMNQTFEYSGNIYGKLSDLKGKNLRIKTGENTLIQCDFYVNDLSDIKNMYLFLDLKHAQTDFNDLSSIKLPNSSPLKNLVFPDPFYESGLLTYNGNFAGFLTDFVAYGTLKSQMGNISTDISFVPGKSDTLKIDGKLTTSDFDMGRLYQNELLGKVSLESQISGNYFSQTKKISGTFDGTISNIGLNNYNYRNISIDGFFSDRKFDGFATIDDPNLQFDFNGELDLNNQMPVFDFGLTLQKADLIALNIDSKYEVSDMAFIMNANFKGNSIDNIDGEILIENGFYRNQNGKMTFEDLSLQTSGVGINRELHFKSDFIDADLFGDYNFQYLRPNINYILSHYLPSLSFWDTNNQNLNNFEYAINIKKLDDIIGVFKPNYIIETPISISGEINTGEHFLTIDGEIPGISNEKIAIKSLSFKNLTNGSFAPWINSEEIQTKSGFKLYNVTLANEANNNSVETRLTWNNFHTLSYSGEVHTISDFSKKAYQPLKIKTKIQQSKVYISDTTWHIDPCTVLIDSNSVFVDGMNFHSKNKHISVEGKISEDPSDNLILNINNISLRELENYFQQQNIVSGIINGTVGIQDLYGETFLSSDLQCTGLAINEQELGDAFITNKWDNKTKVVNSELIIENKNRRQLEAIGYYDPINNYLNYDAKFDHLSIVVLEKLIKNNFSNFHGDAVGDVKIYGNPAKILYDGALLGKNAGLSIDATQVSYHFNDTVRFSQDSIIFDNITLFDIQGNQGILNGSLRHDNYKNMDYDLLITSQKIMAINTTPRDNEQFYGTVLARGNFQVTGHGAKVNLIGSGKTLAGTGVNISLNYEQDAETYDFIQFVDHSSVEKEEVVFAEKQKSEVNMELTIEATPEAKAQIIYNSSIGDVIKGEGEGILKLGMDKDGDINLYGTYNITKGDYLFTLQNIINKRFTIENGGSISWEGDPYEANIDINAVYKLKASLKELFVNNYQNIDYTMRIPVNCKILLSNKLTNPTINFAIDFPTIETRIADEMQQFFNTKEELNRQILSLLVLGQFYTPEYLRGSYEATTTNLIGTTASELLSNQLSNWLSQISNNIDFGVNYRPGSQITNDEIELALSTQIFNDRVILNGNIGNNANPNSNNNSQIVGDFDLNVKLTNNGKLQLKAFNRSNNSLIYETAPYTQGVGFSFKEEYNTFDELMRKIANLFRSRENKK